MLLGGMLGMGNPNILVTPLSIETLGLGYWWQIMVEITITDKIERKINYYAL